MRFEWDRAKATTNLDKHGVSVEEACTLFEDPLSATVEDRFRDEQRWVTVGWSSAGRLILVVHTERTDTIRIISARAATPSERKRHEQSP